MMLANKSAENYVSVRISGIIISWPSVYSSPVSSRFFYTGLFTGRRTFLLLRVSYVLRQLMNRKKRSQVSRDYERIIMKSQEKKTTHEYKILATHVLLLFTHPAPRRHSEKCTCKMRPLKGADTCRRAGRFLNHPR